MEKISLCRRERFLSILQLLKWGRELKRTIKWYGVVEVWCEVWNRRKWVEKTASGEITVECGCASSCLFFDKATCICDLDNFLVNWAVSSVDGISAGASRLLTPVLRMLTYARSNLATFIYIYTIQSLGECREACRREHDANKTFPIRKNLIRLSPRYQQPELNGPYTCVRVFMKLKRNSQESKPTKEHPNGRSHICMYLVAYSHLHSFFTRFFTKQPSS